MSTEEQVQLGVSVPASVAQRLDYAANERAVGKGKLTAALLTYALDRLAPVEDLFSFQSQEGDAETPASPAP